MRGIVTSIFVALLFLSSFAFVPSIQPAKAQPLGIITINPNGSISSPTPANITTSDNVTYTFTGNNYLPIAVERSNIIINGRGRSVQIPLGYNAIGISLTFMINVTIKNTTITSQGANGIYLNDSYGNVLSDNYITTSRGYGIYLDYSSGNILSGNNVRDCQTGIQLWSSSDKNTLSSNNLTANGDGIELYSSSGNVLSGNVMADNTHNFGVSGSSLSDFMNHIDTSNLVDNKAIYYLMNQSNIAISPQTYVGGVGYLGVVNCKNVTVHGFTLTKNDQGLLLAFTNDSRITNNKITANNNGISLSSSSGNALSRNNVTANYFTGLFLGSSSGNVLSGNNVTANEDGISLVSSSENNTLSGNNVAANGYCGVYFDSSSGNVLSGNNFTANGWWGIVFNSGSGNRIFHNNFLNNKSPGQAYSPAGINTWDDGYPSGGNYWSDFTKKYPNAAQIDESGIWNTAYQLGEGNQDNYPLVLEEGTRPPFPVFSWSPTLPKVGEKITYNASLSRAGWNQTRGKMPIIRYRWDFGDGNVIPSTTNSTVTHVYEHPNLFNVTLTVYDAGGLNASSSKSIPVKMSTFISLSTSTPSTLIGFSVNITGRIHDMYGNGLSDETIVLSYSFSGISTWTPIASALTDSFGNYSAMWIPTGTGYFNLKAEWAGNATFLLANATVTLSALPYANHYVFSVESNSTISNLAFNSQTNQLTFTATGPSGTRGYTKVTIAKSLVSNITGLQITFDGAPYNYTVSEAKDSWVLTFTYSHSSHAIVISLPPSVPEFRSSLILLLFMTITLLAISITILKRKRDLRESQESQPLRR